MEERNAIEVFVVEDHLAVRRGLELLLRSEQMRIAGVAGDVDDATALLSRRRFDVALIDLNLPGGSGLEIVRQLLERDRAAAIVLHTGVTDPRQLRDASLAGARGFVLKASHPDALITAVRRVAGGGTYVDPHLAPALSAGQSPGDLAKLTAREREVLDLLAQGDTGQQVADQLYLSPETVRTHVRNAMAKLGARTRVQAVALVVRARG